VSAPPRSEAERGIHEVGLEDRFKDQHRSHLCDTISDRGYTQRPFAAVRLRDHHPLHRPRPVGLRPEILVERLHEGRRATILALDVRDTDTIHTRSTPVTGDPVPSGLKHVAPIDPIVQRVESKLRLRLRFPI
jgi:hypothetical protein